MIEQYPITINYTQVSVYLSNKNDPDLIWTDDHVAQGFSWDPGNVAFGVPDHDGQCWIEVNTAAETPDLRVESSNWAIEVPFDVDETDVEIGTILDTKPYRITPGRHRLIFEAHPGQDIEGTSYAYVLRLSFIASTEQEFKILKQGELASGRVLSKTAKRQ